MKDIIINAGDVTIEAQLNDTEAARDFVTRLPVEADCHDSGADYCGVMAEGKYKESETQSGWKNGDIGLANGWIALFYGGEETSTQWKHQMIIGHMEDGAIDKLSQLPPDIHVRVSVKEDV
jgi:hypothetical protein